MPIILAVDGPSLGGFVCPLTTIEADMWIWGQVRPGDHVYFDVVTLVDALSARVQINTRIDALSHAAATGSAVDAARVGNRRLRLCAI
jgi:urea carboxylase